MSASAPGSIVPRAWVSNASSTLRCCSQSAMRRTSASGGVCPTRAQPPCVSTAAPVAPVRAQSCAGAPARPSAILPWAAAMCASSRPSTLFSRARSSAWEASSLAAMRTASIWPIRSQAARTAKGTRRGSAWWHEIRPHSRPPRRSETDIEAGVPMLRMYSRWTGETLRSAAKLRSSGCPLRGWRPGRIGTGV